MDATFYEDSRFRSKTMLKRPMTLDLDSVKCSKKQRVTTLLTSPDLNMLKLASPELERLIIAQHGLVTTTPTPNQCMYPKNVSEDREQQYSRDFTDALTGLPQPPSNNSNNGSLYHLPPDVNNVVSVSNNVSCLPCAPQPCNNNTNLMDNYNFQPTTCTSMIPPSSTCPVTTNMGCYVPVNNGYYSMSPGNVTIKEEPQTVPCAGVTPPLSPIDMEDQERIKLERKRLRNRIAASKCRRRKLERIARLEDKVAMLKGENTELTNQVNRLREQVCHLKQQVMDHMRCGCEIYNAQI